MADTRRPVINFYEDDDLDDDTDMGYEEEEEVTSEPQAVDTAKFMGREQPRQGTTVSEPTAVQTPVRTVEKPIDTNIDFGGLGFEDEEEETQQAEQQEQAVRQTQRQFTTEEIGIFTLELLSVKRHSINAYWILEAGLRLSPQFATGKNAKNETKLASIIKANETAVQVLMSPQTIDMLICVIQNVPSFKATEFYKVLKDRGSVPQVTTLVLTGLARVEGLVKSSLGETGVEEILHAIGGIDIERKDETVKLRPVQRLEAQKSLTDGMTDEQKALYEQGEAERQAQIAKASQQFADTIEKEGIQSILAELNLRRDSAGALMANGIEGFKEDYTDYTTEILESPYESMINSTAFSIMDIYDQLFETVISLGKVFGALSYRNEAVSVIQVTTKDHKIHLDSSNQKNKNSLVAGWFGREMALKYPTGKLVCADTLQVPTLENLEAGYNCFPGFILRYALGFVKQKRHVKWTTFRQALLNDVKDRLYKILTATATNGASGEDWFNGMNPQKNERLISAFTTGALILNGEVGLNNCQIRVSSFGTFKRYNQGGARSFNNNDPNIEMTHYLGSLLRSGVATAEFIDTNNASVQNRIIDILYLKDSNKYLNTPSWAYQALGRIYGGGLKPDPREGIPIGRTLRGDLVYLRIAYENNKIIISIFAGSRSGKGVTTLSVLGAAYSGGFGVCYGDRKPDMAKIFWEIEREQPGLHTYSFDATDTVPRLDPNGVEHSAVEYLKGLGRLDCADYIPSMLYLKNLQLLALVAQARKMGYGAGIPIVWVLDEITLAAGDIRRLAEAKPTGRKKIEEGTKDDFLTKWYNFIDMAGSGMRSCILEAFGIANINVVMIGQIPGEELGIAGMQSRGPIGALFTGAEQQCNKYIVGRGLGAVSSYGSVALKRKNMQNFNAVENNRFFEIRSRAKANVGDEYESEVFKPFLTLNTDDIYDPCWTTGIGVQYGYDANIDTNGTPEQKKQMRARYEKLLNAEFGDPENTNNGVVHKGVGFYGLLDTYMSYIADRTERQNEINKVLGAGYETVETIMKEIGLLGPGNVFGYSSVEDFLYDLDPDKCFMSLTDLQAYISRMSTGADGVGETEYDSVNEMLEGDEVPDGQESEDGYSAEEDSFFNNEPEVDEITTTQEMPDGGDFFSEEESDTEDNTDYTEYEEEVDLGNRTETVRPQERRGSPVFGAVSQTTKRCEPGNVDERAGQAYVDDKVYGVRLAGNLEDIDSKFNENNRFFNKYGSEAHNKLRQKEIYKAIQKGKNTRNCKKVYIGSDGILINDSYLLGSETYGESAYYSILDSFNFVDFFTKFNTMEWLSLDYDAYELLTDELQFGYGALEKIFRLQPRLKVIEYPSIENGKMLKLKRDMASRSSYVKHEEDRYNRETKSKKILEESFLFGGSTAKNNGKVLLFDNYKNRSRADKVFKRGSTSQNAKRASGQFIKRAPMAILVGGASLIGLAATGTFGWFRGIVQQAKEGF